MNLLQYTKSGKIIFSRLRDKTKNYKKTRLFM